jgi:hypothetical protein
LEGALNCSWFVVGQILAPVALREMKMVNPEEYKIPIYTQWAMIGLLIIIFIGLPESPCEPSASR